MLKIKVGLMASLLGLAGCYSDETAGFVARPEGLVMTGVIDDRTLEVLDIATSVNPGINTIVLQNVPGSVDDEASLTVLSAYIRSNGFTTRVPSDGLVASGGTDMALMGRTRIIDPGACVGVHTWASGGLLGSETGAELARDHPAHTIYLDFYRSVGIDESFYWYTLSAAGPDDVHWMSAEEINQFGLSSIPLPDDVFEDPEQRRIRCESRF